MGSVIGRWFGLSSVVRRLVVATMFLALVAAVAPAFGPSARAQDQSPAAGPVTVQSWVCPLDYAGTDYLDDCTLGGPFGVRLTDPAGTTLTAETTNAGDVSFAGGAAGEYSLGTSLLGEGRASFYYACFDGADVFRFDGSGSVIDFSLAEGDSLFCRVYVTYLSFSQPSAEPVVPANAAFQVFTCPVKYAGDDYLTDCAPVDPSAPVDILLNAGVDFDFDAALTGTTGDEGRALFEALGPGTYLVTLNVSERVNTFYYACFDASSGAEEFLSDGNSVQFTADIAAGGLLSCRWYIIPFDLPGGESASPSASASASVSAPVPSASASAATSVTPSVRPSASSRPGATTGPVATLPSTGTGSGDTSGWSTLPLVALVAVALAAGTVTVARRPGIFR